MDKITNKGINNPAYIDGRCSKKYYCSCGKEITYKTIRCGRNLCRKCAMNSPETKEKLSKSHLGKSTWNKGLKNVQIPYWLGKSNKNIIVRHHIDGNKRNNDESNFLKLPQGEHRSLHWKSYEYVIKIGLVYDYLKDFCLKYEVVNTKIDDGKVVHHIDCNRDNNDRNNFMYLKDKKIHNKLHQEAYKYLVRINKVNDYISWFFLQKKNNHQSTDTMKSEKKS
jgi:hypothetical protein